MGWSNRRRSRSASPRLEALESMVLLSGDPLIPDYEPPAEVISEPTPPELTEAPPTAPDEAPEGEALPTSVDPDPATTTGAADPPDSPPTEEDSPASDSETGHDEPADPPATGEEGETGSGNEPVDTSQPETPPSDPAPPTEDPVGPPTEQHGDAGENPDETPLVEETPPAPIETPAPTDQPAPVDPLPGPVNPPVEASPPPVEVTTTVTPPPPPAVPVDVAPSAENLRVDLAVERSSEFAGRTVRFHMRETNVGEQSIRLEPLHKFDVVVEQNGEVIWKLTDVRRTRAALAPSISFIPWASRGVSVWWNGLRSRGGRGPVIGEVEVYAMMDGVASPRYGMTLVSPPAQAPRPAPQPVRVEVHAPVVNDPPPPVTPPATSNPPTGSELPPPVPASSQTPPSSTTPAPTPSPTPNPAPSVLPPVSSLHPTVVPPSGVNRPTSPAPTPSPVPAPTPSPTPDPSLPISPVSGSDSNPESTDTRGGQRPRPFARNLPFSQRERQAALRRFMPRVQSLQSEAMRLARQARLEAMAARGRG